MKKIFIFIFLVFTFLFSSQIDMLLTACQDKKAAACSEIATLYNEGIGFDQNTSQAKHYYEKACELGEDASCQKLDTFKK